MKKTYLLQTLILIPTLVFATGSNASSNPPTTVNNVELSRYVGLWYEIARLPNNFQDKAKNGYSACYNTIAEYSLRNDGKINVKNTCYRQNSSGEEFIDIAKAKAESVKGSNNSKLKVNFTGLNLLDWLGIGDGDYWILDLGPINNNGQYSWSFVGSPKRDFGWILSRQKTLSTNQLDQIRNSISDKGYYVQQFKWSRKDL